MIVSMDLPTIWAFILAAAVFVYVFLDGFDLGVGILFPFFEEKKSRDVLMNSIAPVWDGNETWLIMGGGGLFAVFPTAYAVMMPALYAPIIVMLLALILRGVAFEFRWRTKRGMVLWDAAFSLGSVTAAFCQGVCLGAILQGISTNGAVFTGPLFEWFSPFSILTGVAVVVGYALLGACWLNMKTTGDVQQKARRFGRIASIATLCLIGLVSLSTPFLDPGYHERWFQMPGLLITAPVPLTLALLSGLLMRSLKSDERDHRPFFFTLGIYFLCFIGLGVSMWPYIVPTAVTIREAAAPTASLRFMLIGAGVLLPLVLCYTAYSYWVFRGKVAEDAGYHS